MGKDCVGSRHNVEDHGYDSPKQLTQKAESWDFYSREGNALLVLFWIDLMAGTHMLVSGTSEMTFGPTCACNRLLFYSLSVLLT